MKWPSSLRSSRAYPRWNDVLEACGLATTQSNAAEIIEEAKNGRSGGGGEGPEHLALKKFVRDNPRVVGLPHGFPCGTTEAPLPSGDRLDVLFYARSKMLAVEVKSNKSNNIDLERGLFQCVKYRAVMEAERAFKGGRYSINAVLVVGKGFPSTLKPLQNSLGVEVIEVIK